MRNDLWRVVIADVIYRLIDAPTQWLHCSSNIGTRSYHIVPGRVRVNIMKPLIGAVCIHQEIIFVAYQSDRRTGTGKQRALGTCRLN